MPAPRSLYFLALSFFIVFAYFLYRPGLNSIFILDDHINLGGLADIDSIYDWKDIVSYLSGGISSALGRPISLLSFVFQYDAWPECPYCFKLVNLLIHLLNGLLIFLTLRRIATRSFPPTINSNHKELAALLVGAAWIIHPIHVSTVLYTVQRMTELSALFTISGLLLFLVGRDALESGRKPSAFIMMTCGVGLAYTLGVFSKENAILISLYVLIIELTTYSKSDKRDRFLKLWLTVFAIIPLISLIYYVSPRVIPYLFIDFQNRNFSAIERGLTELRILIDYLYKIWVPRLGSYGLFHSDIIISKSLFKPITTFFSFLIISSLFYIAIKTRKTHPFISLGILLFFSAHALESSVLNLELYFEHRNYFASLGAIMALIGIAIHLINSSRINNVKILSTIIHGFITMWILLLSFITWNEAVLWSLPETQAEIWADKNPKSYRAQGHYSHILTVKGRYFDAYQNYRKNSEILYRDAAIPVLWLQLKCFDKNIPAPDFPALNKQIRESSFQHATVVTFDEIANDLNKGKCKALSPELVLNLLDVYLKSPSYYEYKDSLRAILIIKSKLHVLNSELDKAKYALLEANNIKWTPDVYINLAYIYKSQQKPEKANRIIQELNTKCDTLSKKCLPFREEIEQLNQSIINSNPED